MSCPADYAVDAVEVAVVGIVRCGDGERPRLAGLVTEMQVDELPSGVRNAQKSEARGIRGSSLRRSLPYLMRQPRAWRTPYICPDTVFANVLVVVVLSELSEAPVGDVVHSPSGPWLVRASRGLVVEVKPSRDAHRARLVPIAGVRYSN